MAAIVAIPAVVAIKVAPFQRYQTLDVVRAAADSGRAEEIALYTGVPRTADVVAETPSVVLRLSRASIEEMERADPELAAALHRWLAATLSVRLNDTLHAFDALLD